MSETYNVAADIKAWKAAQYPRYRYEESFDAFWSSLETEVDVELPSGKRAVYVDMEILGIEDALAVFRVDDEYFAFGGSYSSWGSNWDTGPFKAEKRTITIERWEAL
jgi:hypothetical protein